MSDPVITEAPRRELTARQAATVERLAVATREELAVVGYENLTVRSVASRAEVAPATAYTYFGSKNHLVAETYWRRLVERGVPTVDLTDGVVDRVAGTFRQFAEFLADEPDLSAGATAALLGPHPDVQALRLRIGAYYLERIRDALHSDATDAVVETLSLAFYGAMTLAGMGFITYPEMGDRLADVAATVLGERGR